MRFRLKLLLPTLFWTTLAWSSSVFLLITLIAVTPFDFDHFFNSLASGFLAAVGSSMMDSAMDRRAPRLTTLQTLALRTLLFLLMITVISFLVIVFQTYFQEARPELAGNLPASLRQFFVTREFLIALGILVPASFMVQFFLQLQRMLGPGSLWKMIFATYQKPVEEDRIFVFIDLNHSTPLAESLGPARFAEFKNDFFFDLTDSVLKTGAEIVDYVGDEAILSWKTSLGLRQANWLQCLLLFDQRIKKRSEYYQKRYGSPASFKAAAHEGRVMTTEVGNLKRKIAHSGDCLNAVARMEALCNQTGCRFLASDHLLAMTKLPSSHHFRNLGPFSLRGKSDELVLWGWNKD